MPHSVVPSDAKLAKAVNYLAAQLRVAGKSVKKKIANDDAHDKKCDEKLQRKLLEDFHDRLDKSRNYLKEKMDPLDKKINEMKLAFDMMFELVKALNAKKDELEHNQNELVDKLLEMVKTKTEVATIVDKCVTKVSGLSEDLAQLSTTVDKLAKLNVNDSEDYDPEAAINAIIATFNSAVEDDLADRAFEDDLAEFAATDSDSDDGSESTGSYMYDSDGKGFF